jgi:hypothetical protein
MVGRPVEIMREKLRSPFGKPVKLIVRTGKFGLIRCAVRA